MLVFNGFNGVEVLPNAERTSTVTGSAIDLINYQGEGKLILMSNAGTGTLPTLDVKVQECDTSDGDYTDVSGAAFTQVTDAADAFEVISLKIDEVKRYIKIIGTIGGSDTPTFTFGVALCAISE